MAVGDCSSFGSAAGMRLIGTNIPVFPSQRNPERDLSEFLDKRDGFLKMGFLK